MFLLNQPQPSHLDQDNLFVAPDGTSINAPLRHRTCCPSAALEEGPNPRIRHRDEFVNLLSPEPTSPRGFRMNIPQTAILL